MGMTILYLLRGTLASGIGVIKKILQSAARGNSVGLPSDLFSQSMRGFSIGIVFY